MTLRKNSLFYHFQVIRKGYRCDHQYLWLLQKLSSILLVFTLIKLPGEFKQTATVLEVYFTLQFFLAFQPQRFLLSLFTWTFIFYMVVQLPRKKLFSTNNLQWRTLRRNLVNSHSDWLGQHFSSPCIHKQGKTKKNLSCENLLAQQLGVREIQLFKVI